MIVSDPLMACSMIVAAIICLLILILGFKRPMKKTGELLRMYSINANKLLLQSIHGIKEVIVARKQTVFIEQYKEQMAFRQKQDIKKTVATDAPNSIVEVFCISVIMIVLCVKVLTNPDSAQFIAVLASFAVGAFRILPAIGYISSSFNNIISSVPSLNAVYENIIESRELNSDFYNINTKDCEEYINHKFSNSIKLENITFSYGDNLKKVINDLSLEIYKNESVALVGESGSGKTTLADILDFVESLPDGINTNVGDREVRLSGGQRQRIGIARALYHSPEILILDEATSALDNETEKLVMDAIESLQGNITMIMIAHRLTTVRNCDKIYEIKNGTAIQRKYEDIIKK